MCCFALGGHNDFKLAEMIEYGLLYLYCEIETSVPFLTDFINHGITEIKGTNFAGYCSGGHKCDWMCENCPCGHIHTVSK